MASAMSAGAVASAIASYNQRVRAHLMRFHSYPSGGGGARGVARLSFTVSRSGQVTSSRLGGSSGVAAFDAQAMSMIRQASPFPPIPDEIKNGAMSFSIPVEFTVR
jgi:protein TonB